MTSTKRDDQEHSMGTKARNEGEGTKTADRNYREATREFVESERGREEIGKALLGTSTPLTLNTYGVSSAVYNGASSSLGINNNTRVTGDVWAGYAGGFTLGGNGGATVFGTIQVLEAIIFPAAHDATQRARVTRYLMGIGGV